MNTPSSSDLMRTVEELRSALRYSQNTIRKLRSSPVSNDDNETNTHLENLQRKLQKERVEKERAFDALISLVGNDEVAKRLNIMSVNKKKSPRKNSPKSEGYLRHMGKQVLHLRHQLQESRDQEKEHTLRSMRIMEWANNEIMKDDNKILDEDDSEDEEEEELNQVERQLEFEDEVDILINDVPAKDVTKRRLELERESDDHGVVSFSLSVPIRENEDTSSNQAVVVVVLHEKRDSGWLELGRSEPRTCLWPTTKRTVISFLRTIPVSSQSESKIPKRLRASVYDVGEIAECFGPLQQMTLLCTAVVTDKILRESPRMSAQRSLVPPVQVVEEEEKKMKEEKQKNKTRTTEACPGGILEFENHACSWDLLRTSKSNHTIGRATFSMPIKSRGYVHVSQHAFEAPFTALVPMQLLGLYILRIGGTISFLRQKISASATPDSRLAAALKMQMSLLEEYKKAAAEIVGFGNAHFKSYKRRSDCSAIRFVPNNVQCLEMRAQIGDWHAVYPSLSFAAPAIASCVPLPESCCDAHNTPEQKFRFGLLSFGKLMKKYTQRVSKYVSTNTSVPSTLAEKMTMLSNASARRRDIAFSHILTIAISSFHHTVRNFGHSQVFWRQVRTAGFLVHFESLLSSYAHEHAQIEDLYDAVKMLQNVSVRITRNPPGAGQMPLRILFRRRQYVVEFSLIDHICGTIPSDAYGASVRLVPILITQGVDEMQSFAYRFKTEELQSTINERSLQTLEQYVENVTSNVDTRLDVVLIKRLIKTLRVAMRREGRGLERDEFSDGDDEEDDRGDDVERMSRRKNVDALLLSSQLVRELRGGRITTCAEGVGRTSMAITLEHAILLRLKHQLRDDVFYDSLRTTRTVGVQRSNSIKNSGSSMYSMSSLQRALLPNLLKPPMGTYFS